MTTRQRDDRVVIARSLIVPDGDEAIRYVASKPSDIKLLRRPARKELLAMTVGA
jgi:hypothetical protein